MPFVDPTEGLRRKLTACINDAPATRAQLEAAHGQVWDTAQLTREFNVESFLAPFVVARRVSDGKRGLLTFQHHPRFYWGWVEE